MHINLCIICIVFYALYSKHFIISIVFYALYSMYYIQCIESCCGQTDIVTHRAAIAAKNVAKALLCGQLQTNEN